MPQTPPRQDSHGYSHHPHTGCDVQRVDSDAVEESGDGTGFKTKDNGQGLAEYSRACRRH